MFCIKFSSQNGFFIKLRKWFRRNGFLLFNLYIKNLIHFRPQPQQMRSKSHQDIQQRKTRRMRAPRTQIQTMGVQRHQGLLAKGIWPRKKGRNMRMDFWMPKNLVI